MEMLMLVVGVILLVLSGMLVAVTMVSNVFTDIADGFHQAFYKVSARDPKRERRELLLITLIVIALFSLGVVLVKKSGSYKKTETSKQSPASVVK